MTNEEKKAIEGLKVEIDSLKVSIAEFERDIEDKSWCNKVTGELKHDILIRETILNLLKKQDKEYAELLIKLNAQNLNNSIEQRKESNEQLEALNEGWKIELEKKDNRIKELESDKEIKDKMIDLMTKMINNLDIDEDICTKNIINPELCNEEYSNCKECIKQYFENKAKESGEIDENNRIIE